MANKNIRRDGGFTIIEVLIVLAIAGLILLIVFLAVPALQRNARNTQRKNDVASLASALSEYINNNDGVLPATCTGGVGAAKCSFYNNWKPGYYTNSATTPKFTNNANTKPATALGDPTDVDLVWIASYNTCAGEAASTTGATPRSVAITYDVETGGGGTMEQCVTAN